MYRESANQADVGQFLANAEVASKSLVQEVEL
jgi:hypothetical protein